MSSTNNASAVNNENNDEPTTVSLPKRRPGSKLKRRRGKPCLVTLSRRRIRFVILTYCDLYLLRRGNWGAHASYAPARGYASTTEQWQNHTRSGHGMLPPTADTPRPEFHAAYENGRPFPQPMPRADPKVRFYDRKYLSTT